jgi:PAS domain S-box-containing protein
LRRHSQKHPEHDVPVRPREAASVLPRSLPQASEEEFRLLVQSVGAYAIFLLGAQGRARTWNRGAERINGYRAEEIIGEHLSRFYPPDDAQSGKAERELRIAASEGRYKEEGWRVPCATRTASCGATPR